MQSSGLWRFILLLVLISSLGPSAGAISSRTLNVMGNQDHSDPKADMQLHPSQSLSAETLDASSLHPSMFFSLQDVALLRRQSASSHLQVFRLIRGAVLTMLSTPQLYLPPHTHQEFSSKWNEVYGNNLPPLALYCLLYPEDTAAERLLSTYMDRMASYPDWTVHSSLDQDLPTAHSLTGFATAFDFIFSFLEQQRRDLYLRKIFAETQRLYKASQHKAWGKQFLQSTPTTNFLALLTGALVLGAHRDSEVEVWRQTAVDHMEKTMLLLNRIVDGSLSEGVAYGSYTTRAITQYAFLAQRHFHIDHSQSPWLHQHFWFYYATLLPGFQRTVGIADSNYNWFYGPESQLVFLDSFVMRNGTGNWLAQQIRKHRPKDGPMGQSLVQRWTTLHTEFLWFNASLTPIPPVGQSVPQMHVFPDWGVVTFGAGLPPGKGNTFLSFKSSKLGGQAVFDLVHSKQISWLENWSSFSLGHEHPDQNSFTFAPNGQVFVSEALHGPKLSFLNNVLEFGPLPHSLCRAPWEGQLGECGPELRWMDPEVGDSAGELVTASNHREFIFTSGEAVAAYSTGMGLKSVYRSLVLLDSQTLLVLDHVEKLNHSSVSSVSAFFHNLDIDFKYVPHRSSEQYSGALMDVWDAHYQMFWFDSEGHSPDTQIQEAEQEAEFKKRWTQFINVTFAFTGSVARMAYVMHGPYVKVSHCRFIESSEDGVRLILHINNTEKVVSIATNHRDIAARYRFLGFGGYSKLEDPDKIIWFGLGSQSVSKHNHAPASFVDFRFVLNLGSGVILCVVVVCLVLQRRYLLCVSRPMRSAFIVVLLLWMIQLLLVSGRCHPILCGVRWSSSSDLKTSSQRALPEQHRLPLPTLVVTGLPGSGFNLLKLLFINSSDFLYLPTLSEHLDLPEGISDFDPALDACEWTSGDAQSGRFKPMHNWIHSLVHNTKQLLQNISLQVLAMDQSWRPESWPEPQVQRRVDQKRTLWWAGSKLDSKVLGGVYQDWEELQRLWNHALEHRNARTVLELSGPGWALKIPFLTKDLGTELRIILVMQDPRAWVDEAISRGGSSLHSMLTRRLRSALQGRHCPGEMAPEFGPLRRLLLGPGTRTVVILARLWQAHTAAALRVARRAPAESVLKLRVEDLEHRPLDVAGQVQELLGVPLSPAALGRIQLHSRAFSLGEEGKVSVSKKESWRRRLHHRELRIIEGICGTLMRGLGYNTVTQ
ncbi:hypothetical protein DNTS_004429 [Danionella cerebrum]|uniref:Sulfotransferase domain-containing protein n=1 Tax=Danionella cerebrum TaxID=2873325 RepID=A0A553R788_9TELE|nr:hypothetical protein DNTS_004429 [Danionella translucida]